MTPSATHDPTVALFQAYGAYTPLSAAWRCLSYPSIDAARKAHARGVTAVPMQRLPGRRGLFIATVVLADWLEAQGVTWDLQGAPILRRALS